MPPASEEVGATEAEDLPTERILCPTVEDTLVAGRRLARRLVAAGAVGAEPTEAEPAVLALIGPLGAGKTTLVKGLAEELGIEEPITSPTFALVSQYRAPDRPGISLTHVDLYRISLPLEVESLALDDMLRGTRIMAIEWAEKAPDAIPLVSLTVHMGLTTDGGRYVEIR